MTAPTPAGTAKRRGKRAPEGRMRLAEHMIEFRNRLIVSAIAIVLGMVGGFLLTDVMLDAMRAPIQVIAEARGGKATINFTNVSSAFDLRLQMSLALGIVISSPVWLYEIWMFLVPGLKKNEKLYAVGFLGAAIPLFLAGVWTGWVLLPRIVEVMASFAPIEDSVFFDAKYYYTFVLTLCLAVGVAYVVPVFIVMLNFAGVVEGKSVLKSWRVAVLLVALFAAIATPSADVLSMFFLMVPMIGLYFAAVGVCLLNDRRRARKAAKLEADIAAGVVSEI